MRVKIFQNHQDLYTMLVDDFLQASSCGPSRQIALPTGKTVVPFYRELSIRKSEIQDWSVFPLDEYLGLAKDHPDSFSQTLQDQFFSWATPHIKHRYTWQADRSLIQDALRVIPLDCALLGVGVNGHVAFNEPGSKSSDSIREVVLTKETRERNFGPRIDSSPTHAITLGIKELLETKKLLVVATGASKKTILTKAFAQPGEEIPVSLLLGHKDIVFYFDADAAPEASLGQSSGAQ